MHLSREAISKKLKELSDRRYDDRSTVTPANAFEKFGELNRGVVALYDELEALSKEVLT